MCNIEKKYNIGDVVHLCNQIRIVLLAEKLQSINSETTGSKEYNEETNITYIERTLHEWSFHTEFINEPSAS